MGAIQENGGEELKTASMAKPSEDSRGKVKQREIWTLGNALFFTMADITVCICALRNDSIEREIS